MVNTRFSSEDADLADAVTTLLHARLARPIPWRAYGISLDTYPRLRGSGRGWETMLTLRLVDRRPIQYRMTSRELRALCKACTLQIEQRRKLPPKLPRHR